MSDLISRQAAIDKINERQRKLIYCFGFENDAVKIMDIAKSIIIAIPSEQPEQKLGKWIDDGDSLTWVCSECGYRVARYNNTPYCHNCGADMRTAKCGTKIDLCIMDEVDGRT